MAKYNIKEKARIYEVKKNSNVGVWIFWIFVFFVIVGALGD